MRRALVFGLCLALSSVGCGDDINDDRVDDMDSSTTDAGNDTGGEDTGGEDTGGGEEDAGGDEDTGSMDTGTPDTGGPDMGTPDMGTPDMGMPDMGTPLPPPMRCSYTSDMGMRLLDTQDGDAGPIDFFVDGVPDPSLITATRVLFRGFDVDQAAGEGRVKLNEGPDASFTGVPSNDNMNSEESVDVTGVVAGRNRVRFKRFSADRAYYGIENVRLEVMARVESCPTVMVEPPDPSATERLMRYYEAEYTNRRTWVVGCDPATGYGSRGGWRAYAYTASGEEHLDEDSDCDRLYRPGGSRRGDAIFAFEDVAAADYDIRIRARYTENRNPAGALILVNGESNRVRQISDESEYREDSWGVRRLSGRVEVILRSEGGSDSIYHVRLVPR